MLTSKNVAQCFGIFALTLIFGLFPKIGITQTFEEFSKQIDEDFDSFNKKVDKDFAAFEKSVNEGFDKFVAKIDKDFENYLVENFGIYELEHTKYKAAKAKPKNIPVADEIEVVGDLIEYRQSENVNTYQGPIYPGIKKIEAIDFPTQKVDLNFLGWPLYFMIDKKFEDVKAEKPTPQSIASAWQTFSTLNYNQFLYQVSDVANTLNLNQWGYYQLLKGISKQLYPTNKNTQVLFQWAMLSRSRYKVKIGFSADKLFLLIPSVYKMYNIDYIKVAGINYYVIDGHGEQLQTYDKDFPESDILMDVTIRKPFYTDAINSSKNFDFTYNKKEYKFKLDYDQQIINFYKSIPLSDVSVYFNSVVSQKTQESVKEAFKPILKGKSDEEAANILLAFVQQAFDYKTDQQVFGSERYFFADELLFYPYADCEDRSVLFAYLVKTLLNKEIVALSFPGHMATAVSLGNDIEGAKLEYNNKIFVIADPTLLGATVGKLMPAVMDEEAELITLTNTGFEAEMTQSVWKKTNKSGGFKAGTQRDVIFDKDGNIFVCGYFNGNADFDGIKLSGIKGQRDVFVVKYDAGLNVQWAQAATGTGNDLAFSMALGKQGNLYVYGSFENELDFLKTEINAIGAPDVFVAKYSSDGKMEWAKKAGIDKLDHRLDFMFAAKFNPQGKKIMAKLYSQVEDFDYYGIQFDKHGNASIKGSFYATGGMSSNDFVNYNFEEALKDVPKVLYNTDKKLKEKEYEETIAGLFAALNLLKANTIEIQGNNIKDAFDTYNNSFKNYASSFYESLKNMKFIRNNKGIVSIKTSDGEPIKLDKIKINNDARIRIVKYKSGNILVEVLSGIYVGGGNYWLDMNSIKLFKESGDLLFNFDTDNSVKKLNLKDEILKR